MRRSWFVIVSLCGLAPLACGRLGFDEGNHALDAAPTADAPAGDADPGPLVECPAGFLSVPAHDELGVPAFCVMQFEAKAWSDTNGDMTVEPGEIDADGCGTPACTADWGSDTELPVSAPAGIPWRAVSARTAAAACEKIGPGFHLVANREWMAIARDVERVGANWSGGVPGAGRIAEGRTDGSKGSDGLTYAAVTDPADPYSDTGDSAAEAPGSGEEQRRTLALRNDLVIWDFAGNVQEWIDWTAGAPFDPPPACVAAELPAFGCAGMVPDDYDSSVGTYDSAQGVGMILGGSGNAARRSGQNGDRDSGFAGIYALNMNRNVGETFPGTGFRCVYRP